MKRRGFLRSFVAATIAASLYPVDFVLRHTRKLKATWTMSTSEVATYFAEDLYPDVIADHAKLIRDDIDAQILKMLDKQV